MSMNMLPNAFLFITELSVFHEGLYGGSRKKKKYLTNL